MKSIKTGLLLLIVAAGLLFSSQPAQAQDCVFQSGFKALRDLIPEVVGDCVENERHNPNTGYTLQPTTNGTLVWVKAHNWTAFTDGQRIWLIGAEGVEQPLDVEGPLPWEAAPPELRLTLEQLRNGEYRLPTVRDVAPQIVTATGAVLRLPPLRGEEIPIRFEDGQAEIAYGEGATQRHRFGLVGDLAVFGDLDGDGIADAAVIAYVDSGGSATEIYLIAVFDRDGAPVQAAREFLGERTRVQSLSISGGQIVVTLLAHADDDPLCCPSQKVTYTFDLEQVQRIRTVEVSIGDRQMEEPSTYIRLERASG